MTPEFGPFCNFRKLLYIRLNFALFTKLAKQKQRASPDPSPARERERETWASRRLSGHCRRRATAQTRSSGHQEPVGGQRPAKGRRNPARERREGRAWVFLSSASSGRSTSRATRQIEALGEHYKSAGLILPNGTRWHANRGKEQARE